MSITGPPLKVAILGGGMGALAAAWKLAHEPNAAARYDITVYQRGWRLGGKGASGRNLGAGARIEEHGLHILMGFYDHALGLLRECYGEHASHPAWSAQCGLPPTCRVLPWSSALTGMDTVFVAETLAGGQWDFWPLSFPTNAGQPGVDTGVPTVAELLDRALGWLLHFHAAIENALSLPIPIDPALLGFNLGIATLAPALLKPLMDQLADAIETLLQAVWLLVQPAVSFNVALRRLWVGLCLVGGNLIGLIREGVIYPLDALPRDFSTLDDRDYKDWLRQHLAQVPCPSQLSWDSAPVNGLYDLAFSRTKTCAAGAAVHGLMLLTLNYRGHIYYKMNAGMGDIVFAPLFLALRASGVKFRFFQRVRALRLDALGQEVASIELEEQVGVPQGEYCPLVEVKGIPCWPNAPLAAQLASDYQMALTGGALPYDFELDGPASPFGQVPAPLLKGTDFDVVVLGISVGALPALCQDLGQANQAFGDMLVHGKTMPTRAIQCWLTRDVAALRWTEGTEMASYQRPFNSCANMTQVLGRENLPAAVQTIAYFCDEIREGEAPSDKAGAELKVKNDAKTWLAAYVTRLWPGAILGGGFDWDALYDPQNRSGAARFEAQYWRANVDPSDRYVLTTAGSTRYRLPPGGSGFSNLALAGDWVRTSLDLGCLEGAAMGGLGAARAIIGGQVRP